MSIKIGVEINHNKTHIVFAPNILNAVKREYTKQGYTITTSIDELINKMKEKQK